MNIYQRKTAAAGISIVPMLDILTILLIFFIVHTEFKKQVSVLKLDLPQTQNMAGESGKRDSLLLEIGADGSLALGGKKLQASQLADAVRSLLQEHPDARIQVAAAEGASMGRFIELMDKLSEAGLSMEQLPLRIEYKP